MIYINIQLRGYKCREKNTLERRNTGNIEHISMFDDNTILLVAPASYNTIGKMANGISDNIPSALSCL